MEEIQNTEEPIATDLNSEMVNTIKELKATTVARDKYESDISQLQHREKELLGIIKEGRAMENEETEMSASDLAKTLNSPSITNYEYIKNALKLREKVMAEKGYDPFEAQGTNVDRQIIDGEAVAEILQGLVDQCNEDPAVFTAKLQSALKK